jgi:hypothetical protein
VGRDIDESEGFFRSVSVDAGARNWDWLAEGRSTGSRDAGLGMPEGRGMEDCWSIVCRAIRCTAYLTAGRAFMQCNSKKRNTRPTRIGSCNCNAFRGNDYTPTSGALRCLSVGGRSAVAQRNPKCPCFTIAVTVRA